MVGHPRHQPCRPALLSCFLRAYCHAVVAVVSGMGIVCFVFRIHSVIRPVGNHRRTKGRKGGCSACHAVRILCWTLATVRHGTRLVLRWHIIRVWCPHSVCLSCGNCRRLDIMGGWSAGHHPHTTPSGNAGCVRKCGCWFGWSAYRAC